MLIHRYTIAGCFICLVIPFILAAEGNAACGVPEERIMVGTRFGIIFDDTKGNFKQYTFFAAYNFFTDWETTSGWYIIPASELWIAVLEGEGDAGWKSAGSLGLEFLTPTRDLSFLAAFGVGALYRKSYVDIDYGGPVFFTGEAGVRFRVNRSVSIAYIFHHESNAALYDTNPSLNLHQLEIRTHF